MRIYLYIYTHMQLHVCMYVCMYVRTYVCMSFMYPRLFCHVPLLRLRSPLEACDALRNFRRFGRPAARRGTALAASGSDVWQRCAYGKKKVYVCVCVCVIYL